MTRPKSVRIVEAGARDVLQNEKNFTSVTEKYAWWTT